VPSSPLSCQSRGRISGTTSEYGGRPNQVRGWHASRMSQRNAGSHVEVRAWEVSWKFSSVSGVVGCAEKFLHLGQVTAQALFFGPRKPSHRVSSAGSLNKTDEDVNSGVPVAVVKDAPCSCSNGVEEDLTPRGRRRLEGRGACCHHVRLRSLGDSV
jgi:hypothetical protein